MENLQIDHVLPQNGQDSAPQESSNVPVSAGKLPGPVTILVQAWNLYTSRFWSLIGIYSLPTVMFVLYFILVGVGLVTGGFFESKAGGISGAVLVASILLAILIYIALIYISLWSQVAIIFAIKGADQKIGLKESFINASHKIGSFFGASFYTSFVVLGTALLFAVPGYYFLFPVIFKNFLSPSSSFLIFAILLGSLGLILAIPAIIIGVKYSLATFVVVGDDVKAIPAVRRSSYYVRGYWWPVFWRLLFIGIISVLISILLTFFASYLGKFLIKTKDDKFGVAVLSIIRLLFYIVFPPLYSAYIYKVYENIKAIKGLPQDSADKKSSLLKIIGIVGAVVVVIAIVAGALILPAISSARAKARDAKRLSDVRQFSSAVELYLNEKQTYPSQLSELKNGIMLEVPVAPTPADGSCSEAENKYQYKLLDNTHYELNFCLGNQTGMLPAGSHKLTESGIDK